MVISILILNDIRTILDTRYWHWLTLHKLLKKNFSVEFNPHLASRLNILVHPFVWKLHSEHAFAECSFETKANGLFPRNLKSSVNKKCSIVCIISPFEKNI